MRTFICCLSLLAWTWLSHASAQETIEKNIPINNAKAINFDFHYASANISTWDKNEIQVRGAININNNQENEKFDLTVQTENEQIYIISKVKGLKEKSRTLNISKHKNCCKNKDCCANKGKYNYNYSLDIVLEIKVPKHLALTILATYGELNLNLSNVALTVENTYGGVTASLQPRSSKERIYLESGYSFVDLSVSRSLKLDLELRSSYGEIFTDLDIVVDTKANLKKLKSTVIQANLNGGGQDFLVKAKYGNIYLRALE